MPKKYKLSDPAQKDRREIFHYIARNNLPAACKMDQQLRQAFSLLAEHPHVGQQREELTDKPLRFWPVHTYLIVYKPDTAPLQILRILSAYRDIMDILH